MDKMMIDADGSRKTYVHICQKQDKIGLGCILCNQGFSSVRLQKIAMLDSKKEKITNLISACQHKSSVKGSTGYKYE